MYKIWYPLIYYLRWNNKLWYLTHIQRHCIQYCNLNLSSDHRIYPNPIREDRVVKMTFLKFRKKCNFWSPCIVKEVGESTRKSISLFHPLPPFSYSLTAPPWCPNICLHRMPTRGIWTGRAAQGHQLSRWITLTHFANSMDSLYFFSFLDQLS